MPVVRGSPARRWQDLGTPVEPIEVVVVGASAGGVETLRTLAAALPPDLGAAVLVVLHVSQAGTSVLSEIFDRAGPLPAVNAMQGEPIHRGRIYVAPPNHHLAIEDGLLALSHGPRENGHRPAIDALFRSAAAAYGARAAGVVLSGMLDDGTSGLRHLQDAGGTTLVQDPDDALYPGMPRSAMTHVAVDAVLPLSEIGPALVHLAGRVTSNPHADDPMPQHPASPASPPPEGHSSRFVCPDCGGVLFEYRDGVVERFKCSVGHAYSLESLFDGQAHLLESALWAAVRSLEDRALLLRRMGRHNRELGYRGASGTFEQQAREAADRAALIRTALERGAGDPISDAADAVDPA